MKTGSLLLLATLVLLVQTCAAEEGARRFVDFSMTQAQKTMAVISKAEVQQELRLTADQLAKIAAFRQEPLKEIPSLTNLFAQKKNADQENRKQISDEIGKRYDEYLLSSLTNVLTADQLKRFQQIIWQVDGLKSLERDQELAKALGLTGEQVGEAKEVIASFDPVLGPLYRRLGRQMIAGLSAGETLEGRKEQAESLAGAVTVIEKEEDRDLYDILTPAQRNKWHDLTGKPLQIDWDVELF